MEILNMGKGISLKYKEGQYFLCKKRKWSRYAGQYASQREVEEFWSEFCLGSSLGICRDCRLKMKGRVFEEHGKGIK